MLLTLGLFALALTAAGGLIWTLDSFGQKAAAASGRPISPMPRDTPKTEGARLVFGNDTLLDGTPSGFALVQANPTDGLSLSRFSQAMSQDFPDIAQALEALPETKEARVQSLDQDRTLKLEQSGDRIVVELVVAGQTQNGQNRHSRQPEPDLPSAYDEALELELESLRAAAHYLPCPIWRETQSGEISWVNTAYLDLLVKCQSDQYAQTWPPARLFPDISDATAQDGPVRVSLRSADGTDQHWYEVTAEQVGSDRLLSAVPIDAAIRAEQSLTEFTQTLTKTFAHLPTGLAIFDRDRRLKLFNPALSDLTTIRPEFLIRKPGLHAFLDKLRDKRMIPEPRDYRTWRHHIYTLEVEARNGTYNENWALPNGKTYRVTGQPHPNGAVAFMFEDISAEISMVREHRTEIELFQSVIDEVAEAIVVFNSAGHHVLSNNKYRQEWQQDSDDGGSPETIVEATKTWAAQCAATPTWGDVRDFVGSMSERAEWTASIRRTNGLSAQCRVSPLAFGATLIAFGSGAADASKAGAATAQQYRPVSEGSVGR